MTGINVFVFYSTFTRISNNLYNFYLYNYLFIIITIRTRKNVKISIYLNSKRPNKSFFYRSYLKKKRSVFVIRVVNKSLNEKRASKVVNQRYK